MNVVFQNLWPIHGISWVIFAFVGLLLGYFLANVTKSVLLNILILLGIMFSVAFAVAQGVGMALEMKPEDLSSWASFANFWLDGQDMAWMFNGRLFEVLWSTGIGTAICTVFGVVMVAAGKERV